MGYVSEKLGLPGNPASAYVKARSKHAAREALKAAGVPTPKVNEKQPRIYFDLICRRR